MKTREDLQLENSRLSTESAMLKMALEKIYNDTLTGVNLLEVARWRIAYINGVAAEALQKPIGRDDH